MSRFRWHLTVGICSALACLSTAFTSSKELFIQDFEREALGSYTLKDLAKDFKRPKWYKGLPRTSIALEDSKVLKVSYPKGEVGAERSGAEWWVPLHEKHRELYCSYRVRFGQGFQFKKGGKLPGLAGGRGNTGGDKPNGHDGWSARMMWREKGQIVQYVYHPDQEGIYGDNLPWRDSTGATLYFLPDRWYLVEHHIVMNTPGVHNGLLETWLDGRRALLKADLRYGDSDSLGIDLFQFSTFFGGADSSWAPHKDEEIYFDEIRIAKHRLH